VSKVVANLARNLVHVVSVGGHVPGILDPPVAAGAVILTCLENANSAVIVITCAISPLAPTGHGLRSYDTGQACVLFRHKIRKFQEEVL